MLNNCNSGYACRILWGWFDACSGVVIKVSKGSQIWIQPLGMCMAWNHKNVHTNWRNILKISDLWGQDRHAPIDTWNQWTPLVVSHTQCRCNASQMQEVRRSCGECGIGQDPGILCKMSHLYADGIGSQNQLMSYPFVDGKHEIWPEVQSLLAP